MTADESSTDYADYADSMVFAWLTARVNLQYSLAFDRFSNLGGINLEFRTLFRLTRAVTPSFIVRLTSGATIFIAIAITLPIHSSMGLAQSPPAPAPAGDAKREWPPSIIGAGTFVSLEGRFSVSLPQQNHGLQRLSIATPFGIAKGDSYVWEMKEASFVIGYADAAQAVDNPDTAKQVLTSLREALKKLAAANNGVVGAEIQIELDNHPGIEHRVELFTVLW